VDVAGYNASVIEEFRANGGRVGGPLNGQDVLLVTHRGARTGRERTNPLGFFDDGGTPVVFGSSMGAPTDPQWAHNLRANPDVVVEVGAGSFRARAREVVGDERTALWARLVEAKPFLADHEAKAAGRLIPLFRLERSEA
jgi:deazaflavin-dependent oxidoreductase (nitroreductase family)